MYGTLVDLSEPWNVPLLSCAPEFWLLSLGAYGASPRSTLERKGILDFLFRGDGILYTFFQPLCTMNIDSLWSICKFVILYTGVYLLMKWIPREMSQGFLHLLDPWIVTLYTLYQQDFILVLFWHCFLNLLGPFVLQNFYLCF